MTLKKCINIGWEVGYVIPNAKKCKFLQKKGIGRHIKKRILTVKKLNFI